MRVSRILACMTLVGVVIFIVIGLKLAYGPKQILLQGQIEAREYTIASKVSGRIDSLMVRRGDQVDVGDLLYAIKSPELDAKLLQAEGGHVVASAQQKEADVGARKQQIMVANEQWLKAQAGQNLAKKTFIRIDNLFKDGVIARQKRDEAYTQWRAAEYTEQAALAMYQMTLEGTRKETKTAAAGQTLMAQGAVDAVSAILEDSQMRANRKGEISEVLLYEGELVPSGFPVVSLTDMDDVWAVLQVREDRLKTFSIGKKVVLTIPALNMDSEFHVSYISVMGDFATWRATEAGHDFDMKTFEVELRPLKPIEHLRVGMSVVMKL